MSYLDESGSPAGGVVDGDPEKFKLESERERRRWSFWKMSREELRQRRDLDDLGGFIRITSFSYSSSTSPI